MEKELIIHDILPSGHGIAKENNTNYSILGAFPGDTVKVETYKHIGNTYYAKISSITKASPDRIFTPTQYPFYDANAPWKYLSPEAENRYKKLFVKKLYKHHLQEHQNIDYSAHENIGYRNKVAYTFFDTPKGIRFALYTRGDGKTKKIEQQENILAHPLIEKVGKQFLHFFHQKNITAEQLKYLILRYSFYENNIVAYLLLPETNRKKLPFKKSELENFIEKHHDIKGVVVAYSPAGVRSALSPKTFYTLGDFEVKEKMLDKIYTYAPSLFFQINPQSFTEILIDVRKYIEQHIENHSSLPFLDLFAGIGIIGIELADLAQKVTGVELSGLSKKYALLNAEQNNVKNFSFEEVNVDDALALIQEQQVLIIDPPRRGLTQKTIDAIRVKKPQYIFYISCDPQTQAHDFEKIKDLYSIHYVKAYNLFPKTQHIEALIILKKK